MPEALSIASKVIGMLPELLAMFEGILGADHPDVAAARDGVTALQTAHASASSAAPAS